jgi:hypothetical protein
MSFYMSFIILSHTHILNCLLTQFSYHLSVFYSGADSASGTTGDENPLHYQTHLINTDLATNWAASVGNMQSGNSLGDDFGKPQFHVYKFFPSADSTYEYVAPCSNRGICNQENGVCECFPGYTSDSCATQASLAV